MRPRCRLIHSRGFGPSTCSLGGRRVRSGGLGTFVCAELLVGFTCVRLVHSRAF